MRGKSNSILPIIDSIKGYDRSTFRFDLIAGITVATVAIPQGMAYSLLAGMPAQYGLYALLLPLLVYAIFATSNRLSVGPVAVSAILILSGISAIAAPLSPEYIGLVIATGLLIGIFQCLLGFFRLGFIINFLSHPVIAGFTSAAAVIIIVSQIQYILGITVPHFEQLYDTVAFCVQNCGSTNIYNLVLATSSLLIIIVGKKINKNIPGALLTVVLGIASVYFLKLEDRGVEILGTIPTGLPSFYVIDLDLAQIRLLLPTVLTVSLIGIVESLGIAKALEAKHRDHVIRPNQELIALGLSKIVGSFSQAIPSSGSFSRSAINNESGAKTNLASIYTFLIILLVLIFLTPVFYYLPKAVLAGIILSSVIGLFDVAEAKHLWKIHRPDFFMMLTTFITTLAIGIELGVLTGVILSVLTILYRTSKPNFTELGKIEESNRFMDLERFAEAEKMPEFIILRFEDRLYFANTGVFKDRILQAIEEPGVKYVLLVGSLINDIDSSGISALNEIDQHLKNNGIELHLCGAIGTLRDQLYKAHLLGENDKHHVSINDAMKSINKSADEKNDMHAMQTNLKRKKDHSSTSSKDPTK